jgi:ribosomal-protein-alanine N-acetyltransferase
MIFSDEIFTIEAITTKDSWRLCNFIVTNSDRLKRYFPKTLQQNLNPTLSEIFVELKVKQFINKNEFLFSLKEKSNRSIIGLCYVKEINWDLKIAELAYCIDYQFEGKNIITKTVRYISEYCNKELDLKTLLIIVHKTNSGSVKVAEKCNYKWIKTLPKEHTPPNEAPLDMELYKLHYEK